MVRVERRIRIHKDGKVVEAKALFDTGSRGSYFSREFAEKIGYEVLREPRLISLAVKGKYAKLIGDVTVYLEVEGYIFPERETIGVVEDLMRDVIIGLNIMEKYGIYVEEDEIKFKQIPPSSIII